MAYSGARRKSSKQVVKISCHRSTTFDKGRALNVGKIDILVKFLITLSILHLNLKHKVTIHVFKDITSLGNTDFSQ